MSTSQVDKEIQKELGRLSARGTFSEAEFKELAEKHGKASSYWVCLAISSAPSVKDAPTICQLLCLRIALCIIENPRKRTALQGLIAEVSAHLSHKQYIKGLEDKVADPEKYEKRWRAENDALPVWERDPIYAFDPRKEALGISVDARRQLHEALKRPPADSIFSMFQYVSKYSTMPDKAAFGTSSCFVATATYGSPNHETVLLLRSFRDDVLTNYSIGRLFIVVYWIVGPPLARFINCYPISKKAIAPLLCIIAQCVKKENKECG